MYTKTASSLSYTYTPTNQNSISPSAYNPTNTFLTPPNTSNTNTAPPPNPPTLLHQSMPTPLFHPRHVEQTMDSTGHPSFLYQLLLPSGTTRTVKVTRLETYAPKARPYLSTAPTPSPTVHVLGVAPSKVLPSLPPPPTQPQLPAPPNHALNMSHPKFTPHPLLYQDHILRPENYLNSLSIIASAYTPSWRPWTNRFITPSSNNNTTNWSSSNSSWPYKNNR